MKKCTLTQVPCRKAIAEVVKANKNKKSLQLTYEVAKLFQIVMTDENSTLSKEDWKRYFIITKLFMIKSKVGDESAGRSRPVFVRCSLELHEE